MLPNELADDRSAFGRGACGRVNDEVIVAVKGRVIDLLARHSSAPVHSATLTFFEDVQRGPYCHQVHRAARQSKEARLKFRLISEHDVNNDLELRVDETRKRRSQVLAVNVIRLALLLRASHIAAPGHRDEGIQGYVKSRNRRSILKRFRKTGFPRARGAV